MEVSNILSMIPATSEGTFWASAFGSELTSRVSEIDNILAKEKFTLEELLDDDNVIEECKNQNPQLLNWYVWKLAPHIFIAHGACVQYAVQPIRLGCMLLRRLSVHHPFASTYAKHDYL